MAPHVARAQAMREVAPLPADCRSLLPAGMRGTVQPWQHFVAIEHCDRIKRLVRLSALLPPDQQPRFYEGIVPASRLPGDFGVDIPVLRVVFPERTFFDTGRSATRAEADPVLAIVAESLRNEPPDVALFVAGHADARGARTLNERLSIDRADAIAQRIFAAGISLSSVWRVGFGSDMPLVAGDAPYAWDRNRRVEFLFAAKPEAVGTWLADQQIEGLCTGRTRADVDQCRARLDLVRQYEAIEVGRHAPPRTPVEPPPPPRTTIAARQHAAAATIDRSARQTALIGLDRSGARRIVIDPHQRRIAPVPLDL